MANRMFILQKDKKTHRSPRLLPVDHEPDPELERKTPSMNVYFNEWDKAYRDEQYCAVTHVVQWGVTLYWRAYSSRVKPDLHRSHSLWDTPSKSCLRNLSRSFASHDPRQQPIGVTLLKNIHPTGWVLPSVEAIERDSAHICCICELRDQNERQKAYQNISKRELTALDNLRKYLPGPLIKKKKEATCIKTKTRREVSSSVLLYQCRFLVDTSIISTAILLNTSTQLCCYW